MIKKKINTENGRRVKRREKCGRRKSLERRKRVEFIFQVGKSCWNYPFAEGEDDGHSSYTVCPELLPVVAVKCPSAFSGVCPALRCCPVTEAAATCSC